VITTVPSDPAKSGQAASRSAPRDAPRGAPSGDLVDRDARMQQLYDLHAKPLYRFLLRLKFGDRLAAEDLLQETLLRAWKKIDGLNADVTTLRPWLLTVARRLAIDAARASQIRPTEVGSLDLANLAAAGDEGERVLSLQIIRQAMAGLSPEHREVIFEVYFGSRSSADTAV
jgi:RNA polymerase sigma-70 factor (ECF subfamily)